MEIVERLSVGRTSLRAPRHPSGLNFAVRYSPPVQFCEGYEDAFVIDDECIVTVQNTIVRHRFRETEPGLGRLLFLFHLSGARVIDFPGYGSYHLGIPSLVIMHAAEGIPRRTTWIEGQSETFVCVGVGSNGGGLW